MAAKLSAEGYNEDAIGLLEQVFVLRQEQPQSARDLALALSLHLETLLASEQLVEKEMLFKLASRIVSLFRSVIVGNWDARFAEIEVTALLELNSLRGANFC